MAWLVLCCVIEFASLLMMIKTCSPFIHCSAVQIIFDHFRKRPRRKYFKWNKLCCLKIVSGKTGLQNQSHVCNLSTGCTNIGCIVVEISNNVGIVNAGIHHYSSKVSEGQQPMVILFDPTHTLTKVRQRAHSLPMMSLCRPITSYLLHIHCKNVVPEII